MNDGQIIPDFTHPSASRSKRAIIDSGTSKIVLLGYKKIYPDVASTLAPRTLFFIWQ